MSGKGISNGNPKKDPRGQDREEIRQIQILMIFCLFLSSEDKLHQLLQMALAVNGDKTFRKIEPSEDVSIDGLFNWLSNMFSQGELTEEEKKLLTWQNDGSNMVLAISEIRALQDKFGFKLTVEKNS
ncbi:MAG: hypothetical protein GDA56_25210 [Hormoscilla sp. GM7CHS1pb]|nr:hypothetical protein [Hormoscilla sp. GM7CHS1pb]